MLNDHARTQSINVSGSSSSSSKKTITQGNSGSNAGGGYNRHISRKNI